MAAAEYEIIIRGRLGSALTQSFEGLEMRTCGHDQMRLRGWFVDQAALQGLLTALGDLGIELSAVQRLSDAARARMSHAMPCSLAFSIASRRPSTPSLR